MLLSMLFIILLCLAAVFVVCFFWLRKVGKIDDSKKISTIELINLFSAIGGILSFLFVLSSYYIDKNEKRTVEVQNIENAVSDFLISAKSNKKAVLHFLQTKAPGHDSEKAGILDYSYFVPLETTQISRLLSNSLVKDSDIFEELLSLSEMIKKYNLDLQHVRNLSYPLLGENMIERMNLLIIIKHDSRSILSSYDEIEEKFLEMVKNI